MFNLLSLLLGLLSWLLPVVALYRYGKDKASTKFDALKTYSGVFKKTPELA